MESFQIHTTVLRESVAKHPSKTALKVPIKDSVAPDWRDISFAEFQDDVEFFAKYWADKLEKQGAKPRSVVGIWVKGVAYSDVLHQWAIARAGYIPQFCSLRMTNPTVVYQLLERAKAVALIHDESSAAIVKDSPIPAYPATDISGYPEINELPLPTFWEPTSGDDTIMIFHTSGSTSGSPKLVPMSARWTQNMIGKLQEMSKLVPSTTQQPTSVAMGSFSFGASSMLFMQSLSHGGCYILPSDLPYPVAELRQMIDEHGLSVLPMFPPTLSAVLRRAHSDPELLASLQKLDYLLFGGLELDPVDVAWAQDHGLTIVNVFASTELSLVMLSDGSKGKTLLQRIPTSQFELMPLEAASGFGKQLYELVVPPDVDECPDASLRSPEDGKFHTGDLFVEVEPGRYTFKGRNDDWIKMDMALRCDTGSIEKHVMETCGDDLVDTVVVVGVGRPSPTIIVEPLDDTHLDFEGSEHQVKELRDEIFRRISPFHKRRYMHERVDDARFIIVMPKGTLPRTATKGNVRRKQTEEAFVTQLNGVYNC